MAAAVYEMSNICLFMSEDERDITEMLSEKGNGV